jgi:uncharacterized membrane protein YfcA
MTNIIPYLLLGLGAGILSGIVGIGGGIVIIPALIYLFGFTQQQAQGTTLALMVPPIGLLAAWAYYTQGFVDLKVAGLICLGFFVGGYVGGKVAISIPNAVLQKVFGGFLLIISLKMLFSK